MRMITDEVGSGQIDISTPANVDERRGMEERSPVLQTMRKIEISYRPEQPLPRASLVTAVDDGRCRKPANDNQPVRYHLQEMAQRGELRTNEPENRRHWFDAERFKRDIAISEGEPLNDSAANDWRELAMPYIGEEIESMVRDIGLNLSDDIEFEDTDAPGECAVVDNAEGECDQIRLLYAQQVISLAEQVLGHDLAVLKSANPSQRRPLMANKPANRTLKKSDVLRATKIPNHTFQHWYDRRVIGLSGDDVPGDGKGKPRRFGVRSVIRLAIAHKISRLGLPANIAVKLASKFTDTPQHGRPIGGVFPNGLTYILATPDGPGSVVNVQADEDIGKFLQDVAIVVNVNKIISSINFEIGIIK